MSTQLINSSMMPSNLTEAMKFAEMISTSSFCPSTMRGKAGDVLLAMQMGFEVGLNPMQAIQNIAVINGRPCLWGDGALAVILGSPAYEYHKEWEEGSIADGNLTAYCLVKRKGNDEYVKEFSMEDAKKANLWDKPGPWKQYPGRMLQMRARAFAIRDQFADALRGIAIREEVEDYEVIKRAKPIVKAPGNPNRLTHTIVQNEDAVSETIITKSEPSYDPAELDLALKRLSLCTDLESLKVEYKNSMDQFKGHRSALETLVFAKDMRKADFEE